MPFPYSPRGWWKADAIAGPPADGTVVASWPDSSGRAATMANANGAEQPLFKTGLQNGLPGVRFDGANDVLSTPDVISLTAGEWFAVVIPRAITGNDVLGIQNDGGGGWNFGLRIENAGTQYAVWAYDGGDKSARSTTVPTVGVCVLVNGDVANAGQAHLRINKVLEGTGPLAGTIVTVPGTFTLGRTAPGGDPFQGDILEFLYYDHVLTAPERDDTAQQLLNKYALPGAQLTAVAWAAAATFTVAPVLVVTASVAWAGTATFAVVGNTALVAAVAWAAVATWTAQPVLPLVGAAVAWVTQATWTVVPFAARVGPFVSVGFHLPDWGMGHIVREMEQDKEDAGLPASTELLSHWIGREGD